jgi:hypothetical protein
MSNPKRIVYLFGAGSTQAEVDFQGGKIINLLMKKNDRGEGVAQRILTRGNFYKTLKIDSTEEIDVEKLISLLLSSGNVNYKNKAEKLRELYYEELVSGFNKTGILVNPELSMGLLELHRCPIFNEQIEKLSGFIILNHDNLLQTASQRIYNCVNLGFKFHSKVINCANDEELRSCPLVIKLYGSFDWRNKIPIEIEGLNSTSKYSKNMLWIPPSIRKETGDYPYNKLAGLAYELLAKRCDVLRVIGCSLSQNDWNVISLLFNSQYNQLLQHKTCYRIELIMDQFYGKQIVDNCSYLQNLCSIEYLNDGDFSYYKEEERGRVLPKTSDLDNPFKYWLKTKTKYHMVNKQLDIATASTLKKIVEET